VHLHKKFQKIIAFTAACLKSLNSIYGTQRPLGVKNCKILPKKGKEFLGVKDQRVLHI
jgi:hypothetical protein